MLRNRLFFRLKLTNIAGARLQIERMVTFNFTRPPYFLNKFRFRVIFCVQGGISQAPFIYCGGY